MQPATLEKGIRRSNRAQSVRLKALREEVKRLERDPAWSWSFVVRLMHASRIRLPPSRCRKTGALPGRPFRKSTPTWCELSVLSVKKLPKRLAGLKSEHPVRETRYAKQPVGLFRKSPLLEMDRQASPRTFLRYLAYLAPPLSHILHFRPSGNWQTSVQLSGHRLVLRSCGLS
jgi:hypothetical protein